ncbi:MAG: exonuclease domain-containing protein [Trichococcus flocculiformis]
MSLTAFVGDAPILGHNVKFDIGFLRKAGLFEYQQTIDTYELASVLMPTASRYNLGSLGQQLNILLPATHRALDDARVTQAAYVRLFEMACELPLNTLNEIVQLGDFVNWDAGWVFQQALKNRSKEAPKAREVKLANFSGPMFESAKKNRFPFRRPKSRFHLTPKRSLQYLNTAARSRNILNPTNTVPNRWKCSRR